MDNVRYPVRVLLGKFVSMSSAQWSGSFKNMLLTHLPSVAQDEPSFLAKKGIKRTYRNKKKSPLKCRHAIRMRQTLF